jgi:hypothetical protein
LVLFEHKTCFIDLPHVKYVETVCLYDLVLVPFVLTLCGKEQVINGHARSSTSSNSVVSQGAYAPRSQAEAGSNDQLKRYTSLQPFRLRTEVSFYGTTNFAFEKFWFSGCRVPDSLF